MTSPYLQITAVGLSAGASVAAQGAKLKITGFKVGSGYGYLPSTSGLEVGLHGSVLYSGTITSYTRQSDGSLLMICLLPAQAGPFDFGELGIYLEDGTMLASTAFTSLQSKYTSLTGNVASTFEFNLFLKLDQADAYFQILADGSGTGQWALQSDMVIAQAQIADLLRRVAYLEWLEADEAPPPPRTLPGTPVVIPPPIRTGTPSAPIVLPVGYPTTGRGGSSIVSSITNGSTSVDTYGNGSFVVSYENVDGTVTICTYDPNGDPVCSSVDSTDGSVSVSDSTDNGDGTTTTTTTTTTVSADGTVTGETTTTTTTDANGDPVG